MLLPELVEVAIQCKAHIACTCFPCVSNAKIIEDAVRLGEGVDRQVRLGDCFALLLHGLEHLVRHPGVVPRDADKYGGEKYGDEPFDCHLCLSDESFGLTASNELVFHAPSSIARTVTAKVFDSRLSAQARGLARLHGRARDGTVTLQWNPWLSTLSASVIKCW